MDYGEQMEAAEPDQPQLPPSPGRFVVVAVGLAVVALGIAAGGIFRPIGTNVVDRSSAVSRALLGLLIGVVVTVAVMSVVRRLAWWNGINKPLVGSLAVLGIVAVSLVAVSTAARHPPVPEPRTSGDAAASPPDTVVQRPAPDDIEQQRSSPLPQWVKSLAVLILIAVLGLFVVFLLRLVLPPMQRSALPRYRPPRMSPGVDDLAVDEALERSIEALLDDPDPRVAIKAAYAFLLDALAGAGFPRIPSEAPYEHLSRCLSGMEVDPMAMQQLLDVYSVARFSTHGVGEPERAMALGALRTAQQQLRQRAAQAEATADERAAAAHAEAAAEQARAAAHAGNN